MPRAKNEIRLLRELVPLPALIVAALSTWVSSSLLNPSPRTKLSSDRVSSTLPPAVASSSLRLLRFGRQREEVVDDVAVGRREALLGGSAEPGSLGAADAAGQELVLFQVDQVDSQPAGVLKRRDDPQTRLRRCRECWSSGLVTGLSAASATGLT